MIRSMTGFGKANAEIAGQQVTVEITSVNHRYLDISLRAPSTWASLEPDIKQFIRSRLARGKLCVSIGRKHAGAATHAIRFDPATAQQYVEASKELADMLGNGQTLSLDVLAQLEGVFVAEEPEEDIDRLRADLTDALGRALDGLDTMRTTEGNALAEDVRNRIALLRASLANVETRLPDLNERYQVRLHSRIEEFGSDLSLTEERIAIEVAMLAEKADVTEEVVRLKTHLEHMEELLVTQEPVGRRLDFLSQEIQREVNTLGVKTRDSDVTKDVLTMKAELEKIREQVQNIE